MQLQKSGLSPVTVPDALKLQASSKAPPKPIQNDSVEVRVGVCVGVIESVEVGVGVIVL